MMKSTSPILKICYDKKSSRVDILFKVKPLSPLQVYLEEKTNFFSETLSYSKDQITGEFKSTKSRVFVMNTNYDCGIEKLCGTEDFSFYRLREIYDQNQVVRACIKQLKKKNIEEHLLIRTLESLLVHWS